MADSKSPSAPTNSREIAQPPPRSLYNAISDAVRTTYPITLRRRNSAPANDQPRRPSKAPTMNALTRQNLQRPASPTSSSSTISVTPRPASPEMLEMVEYEPEQAAIHIQTAQNAQTEFREVAIRLAMVSRELTQHPDPAWQARARRAQVDAANYMHMALPTDLDPVEAASITATLPREVLAIVRYGERPRENALRRIVAIGMTRLIAMVFFLIPLLVTCLNSLLKYERDHHVTERIFANAQDAVSQLGVCGLLLSQAFNQFLQSPVGRRLMELVLYMVEGLLGGVVDGYEPHLQVEPTGRHAA